MSRSILFCFAFLLSTLFAGVAAAENNDLSPSPAIETLPLICELMERRDDWLEDAHHTERIWGLPIAHQLAFMIEDWNLKDGKLPSKIRPNWTRSARPTPYVSSGAIEATWNRYRADTGNRNASNNHFSDRLDFLGWYFAQLAPALNIMPNDAANQYILWRKGPDYFVGGKSSSNGWMTLQAETFQNTVEHINVSLQQCSEEVAKNDAQNGFSIDIPIFSLNTNLSWKPADRPKRSRKTATTGQAALRD